MNSTTVTKRLRKRKIIYNLTGENRKVEIEVAGAGGVKNVDSCEALKIGGRENYKEYNRS